MRTTLVTAIFLGRLVGAAIAEGDGSHGDGENPHHWGKEGHHGEKGVETQRGGSPPFRSHGEMFRRMDRDRDGKITKEEFLSSPRLARLPEEKRDKFFSRLDRDNDGLISREEIREMRNDAQRGARDEFRKLDVNGSGGLDFSEFSKGEFFGKLPEEKRRQIFERMDTDGSGEITAEDHPKGPPHRRPEEERDRVR